MSLSHTVAIVTGGVQGLGKAFSRAILERGGKVCILDVQTELGLATETEFNTQFGNGSNLFIKCDVTKEQDLQHAFRKSRDTFGHIDLVVNNAGVATMNNNWRRTVDINLVSVMQSSLLAIEYMSTKHGGRGGHVINISSGAGLVAVPFDPAYAASKHGVVGLTRSLALIYEAEAVRVSCLCPSFTESPLKSEGHQDPKYQQLLKEMGRITVAEVVAAFVKLATEPGLTGAVMSVTREGAQYVYQQNTPQARL